MIKVEGISKRYARFTAVDDVSFEVAKGQIVGFLGPNGAGKTTTMRMLTCFLPPSEGTASVAGFDVIAQPLEVKKRIGYLPENPPLYPDMEVAEYLQFAGKLKGVRGADLAKRVGEVAEKTNIGDVLPKLINKLSKGYRQRVGLAQALLHNPEVLILDEPTSGLDPKQINETRQLIRSLGGDHTIILSTHILPEVEQTCERVVIISKGKLVATDTVENLTSRMRGAASIGLEVQGDFSGVQERLEKVSGVAKVTARDEKNGRRYFEIETAEAKDVNADLARAVVEGGYNLTELKALGVSLEDVFLQLTSTEAKEEKAQ
ncbi:MAG: ATP-binding cassette domain-containing protein [Acidobacteria bacterium]|nr:ATP-binding cassette domain-containing protein [Acidobacteriota bacterium]